MLKTHIFSRLKFLEWLPKNNKIVLTARRAHSTKRKYKERWSTAWRVSWSYRERRVVDRFGTNRPDTTWTWYNSPHSTLRTFYVTNSYYELYSIQTFFITNIFFTNFFHSNICPLRTLSLRTLSVTNSFQYEFLLLRILSYTNPCLRIFSDTNFKFTNFCLVPAEKVRNAHFYHIHDHFRMRYDLWFGKGSCNRFLK